MALVVPFPGINPCCCLLCSTLSLSLALIILSHGMAHQLYYSVASTALCIPFVL